MDRIRILLIDLPRMLQDLVQQAIAAQPDMVVVEPLEPTLEIGRAVESARADVVVVPSPSPAELRGIDDALFRQPRLKVIGITRDGRDVRLRELRPRTVQIGNVGPQELADTIRGLLREEPAQC